MIQQKRLTADLLSQIILTVNRFMHEFLVDVDDSPLVKYHPLLKKYHPLLKNNISLEEINEFINEFDLSHFYSETLVLVYLDKNKITKPYPPGIQFISSSGRFAVIQNNLFTPPRIFESKEERWNYTHGIIDDEEWDELSQSGIYDDILKDYGQLIFDMEKYEFINKSLHALLNTPDIPALKNELLIDEENLKIISCHYDLKSEPSILSSWDYTTTEDGSISKISARKVSKFMSDNAVAIKCTFFHNYNDISLNNIFYLREDLLEEGDFRLELNKIKKEYSQVSITESLINKILKDYEYFVKNDSTFDSMPKLLAKLYELKLNNNVKKTNEDDHLPF